MNDELFLDNEFANTTTKKKPVFLLVLCILTFCGSGLAVMMNIYYGASYSIMIKSFESINNLQSNFGSAQGNPFSSIFGDFSAIKEGFYWNAVLNWTKLIIHIPLIISAVYMLKLKKNGFYFYISCQVLMIFANSFLCYKLSNMGIFGYSIMIYAVMGLLGSIAFSIMYSVNLKHLK